LCPAPPVNTQTKLPLPCSILAGLSPTPTCGPLPDWAFQTPGRPVPWHRKNHFRPPSPSQLSDDLHLADHVPRGRYPSGLFTVCPGLPPGHSFHRNDSGDFSRPNTEASSYPSVKGFRYSAPSSAKFTGKPFLSGLSWLSYSWSPDLPEIPECGLTPGPACHQVENSPRQPG
jgi:hypothetical protein